MSTTGPSPANIDMTRSLNIQKPSTDRENFSVNFDKSVMNAMDNADNMRERFGKSKPKTDTGATFEEMVYSGMQHKQNVDNPKDGMKGYSYPNHEYAQDNLFRVKDVPKYKEDKYKAGSINHHLRLHGFVPSAKYDVPLLLPWGKDHPTYKVDQFNMVNQKKGKIGKEPKITMSEEIMRRCKKDGYPGPVNKYNPYIVDGFDHKMYSAEATEFMKCDQQEKFLSFHEHSKWLSKQTPGAKYTVNWDAVDAKTVGQRWAPETVTMELDEFRKKDKHQRNLAIKKDKHGTTPCDNPKLIDAFYFTQQRDRKTTFKAGEKKSFIDDAKRLDSQKPGAGTYFKELPEDEALKAKSMPPRELRIHRH